MSMKETFVNSVDVSMVVLLESHNDMSRFGPSFRKNPSGPPPQWKRKTSTESEPPIEPVMPR